MKKTLLGISFLLGLGLQSYGQGVFTPQNSNLAPEYLFDDMQVIDANTVWALAGKIPAAAGDPLTDYTYARTTDAGVTWRGGLVTATGLSSFGIVNIVAGDATTAWAAVFPAVTGGTPAIIKTTNGGTTWTQQTTAAFMGSDAFPNFVHFFDNNNGVCQGDPNVSGTSSVKFFEIYTTSNGGTTWTRVPRTAAITTPAGEYSVVNQYCTVGNTIWFLTGYETGATSQVRVFRSLDRGVTWAALGATPFLAQASGIAFTDANNGVVWKGAELASTTDGGATWSPQPYSTPFRRAETHAIPNTNTLVSVGADGRAAGNGPFPLSDFGVSVSRDNGATWRSIDTGTLYSTSNFLSSTVGWAGGRTTAVTGGGAIGKYIGTSILAGRNAELQKVLTVYPNPSTSGVFTVQLASGLKTGATVRVLDVVGRQVAAQTLNATAVAAKSTTVDLSSEQAGIYTLELRTEAGVAQQKLVVE